MLVARSSAFVLSLCACAPPQTVAPISPVVAPTIAETSDEVAIAPPQQPVGRCVSGPGGRTDLVPNEASIVGAIDIPTLWSSKFFLDNRQVFDKSEATLLVDTAATCDVAVERWQRVTFGLNHVTNDFAIVIVADGIGLPRNVSCIGEALARKTGKHPWTKVEGSKPERFTLQSGPSGWVLDECTVVLATANWIAPIERLVDGSGTSVLTGALEPPMRRSLVGRPVWVAASVPTMAGLSSSLAGAQDVSASIDLSAGLVLTTAFGFGDAILANRKAVDIRKAFLESKPMFTTLGIPQPVLERVQIAAQGSTVAIDARLTDEDVAVLGAALRKI